MDFKRKGPDVAEVACSDGKRILFSYGEPVAVFFPADPSSCATVWRTERYISRTTERHISEFAGVDRPALRVPHDKILTVTKEAC